VVQYLEISIDSITRHQERLLQESLLALRNLDPKLLADAVSERQPKPNIPLLKARHVSNNWRNMLPSHDAPQRMRVLDVHPRLVNLPPRQNLPLRKRMKQSFVLTSFVL